MPFSAVGQGNVLHPLSVQDVLPDELVVGQDARFGQAEAVQPAAVAGVGGFARLLRGGIHQPGGVHAAGAHAQHDAVVIVEQPRQAQLGKKVVLLGDGVPVYREKVQEILQRQCEFAPASCNRQRAACVAVLGQSLAAAGKTVSSDDFAPEYLRMSQAERERMEADEAHRELMKAGITK